MSSILPLRSEPKTGGQEPRVVDLSGEDADAVFSALSSGTARKIVACLHEEPRTQSEIADAIETSVQNVRYHLDKLENAGLVEVVDTWYSSRGNEMKVYAPADGALIVSGDEGRASRLKAALSRLVGGVGVVAMASLLVQSIAGSLPLPSLQGGGAGGADQGAPAATETTTVAEDLEQRANQATANGTEATTTAVEEMTGTTTAGDGGAGDATRTTVETTFSATETTTEATRTAATETTMTTATRTTETYTTQVSTTEPVTTTGGAEYVNGAGNASTPTTTEAVTTTAADAAATGAVDLEPGVAFFLGGVSVLVVVVALWYWSGN